MLGAVGREGAQRGVLGVGAGGVGGGDGGAGGDPTGECLLSECVVEMVDVVVRGSYG